MQLSELEEYMKIVQDLKKEISYNKSEGKWYWCDRGETEYYGPFSTFLETVSDIVEPYLIPER